MASSDDDQPPYDLVMKELTRLYGDWRDWQEQVRGEITEYKKTVNNALSLLGQEALNFQDATRKRLEQDRTERLSRQKRADIKDAAVLGMTGCLVLFVLLLIGLLVMLLWQSASADIWPRWIARIGR
jgi:hypothetical protein